MSPDGNTALYRAFYFKGTGPRKVEWHTIDVSGDHERTLNVPEQFSPVVFMPHGDALYGVDRISAAWALTIVPLDSSKPVRVFDLPSDIHDPVISPDGRRFAVLADPHARDSLAGVCTVVENDRTSVYVLNADGSDGAWWCSNLEDITQVVWAPEGGRLGDADLRVPAFQGRELFILLVERGKTVRMVTYPGSPHFPGLAEQVRNVFQEVGNWLEKCGK